MYDAVMDALRSAKWLPQRLAVDGTQLASANWLEILWEWWRSERPLPARARWIERQLIAGAQLTVSLPLTANSAKRRRSDCDLSSRLYWWPQGIPAEPWIAIVSSRLGRRLDQRPEWFEVFRTACQRIDVQRAVLLAGEHTTTARFADRAACLFQMPMLTVHEPRTPDLAAWLRTISRAAACQLCRGAYELYLSPSLESSELGSPLSNLPIRDRAVVAWADELIVAHLRRGGNLERLVRARLIESQPDPPAVFLASGQYLVPPLLTQDLQTVGASQWQPQNDSEDSHAPHQSPRLESALKVLQNSVCCSPHIECGPVRNSLRAGSILSWESFLEDPAYRRWKFLTHCTRTPDGPWPEQTEQEYLDELLLGCRPASRTPLAALMRIVSQRRIRASGVGLRGGTPAVCFTAVPLTELHRLRTFQPQRQRWDFEPYGICVSQKWLVTRGARAVTYGDDHVWKSLSESERPFFQMHATRRGKRQRLWIQEREWRHLGDVNLSRVRRRDALLFVPQAADAEALAQISRWPVVVCRAMAGCPTTDDSAG